MVKSRKQRSRSRRTKRRGGYLPKSWFSKLTGSKLVYKPDDKSSKVPPRVHGDHKVPRSVRESCNDAVEEFDVGRFYDHDEEGKVVGKKKAKGDMLVFKNTFIEDAFNHVAPNLYSEDDNNDGTKLDTRKEKICGKKGSAMVGYSQYQPQNMRGLIAMSSETRNAMNDYVKAL